MKYMLMFWEDESAAVTAEEGAAGLTAIRSWVDEMTDRGIRLHGSELEPVELESSSGARWVGGHPFTCETSLAVTARGYVGVVTDRRGAN